MFTVTSEIYDETNFNSTKDDDGKIISRFEFKYPSGEIFDDSCGVKVDSDGDLLVRRKDGSDERRGVIEIKHFDATEIRFVGLQVWRGALLVCDFIFNMRDEFKDKQLLELGAGVGLASIAAAIYVKKVICSDVNIGGILELIRSNVQRNEKLFDKNNIEVLEYDFMLKRNDYSHELLNVIDNSEIIVAADVIYDEDLTCAFINVLEEIFQRQIVSKIKKTVYLAMEKRYVFKISECDSVAPMFEHFIKLTMAKPWKFEYINTDFTQYFEYERCTHLVLIKITSC